MAPRYLAGEIELGVVTQSAMAFAQVLGAFSLIVVAVPDHLFVHGGRRATREAR
ncbi:MAG: hypothetical protein ABSE49_00620 [Polyangiaceae bacterium]